MNSKRCRILYVELPGVIGGTITGLYELVRHLDTSCYEPIVLFYRQNHPYRDRFERLGIKVLTLGEKDGFSSNLHRILIPGLAKYQERLARGYWAASVVARVAFLLKKERIDLVHHNDNLPKDRYTIIAARIANVPQVCHIRTLKELSILDRQLARSVNFFIYMSKAIEQLYLESGISVEKGQVIYDGFDPTDFKEIGSSHTAKVRAEFGIDKQDRIISNIGRLDNWKGQDYFITAIAEVVKDHPNIKAVLVGAPESTPWNQIYYQKLQKMVKDLQLTKHVIFTGHRTDVPQIMASSDIIVHSSSKPEPFGRVIVEGMLAARPVIATAAGGALDIIEDKVTGILVPPKDADKMAKAILWLLQNTKQTDVMSRKACERAKERFSVERHVSLITQVYQKVLA